MTKTTTAAHLRKQRRCRDAFVENALQKTFAIQVRAAKRRFLDRNIVYCDICKAAPGFQRHHIYPRSMTLGKPRAADRANVHYVNAMLCQVCHDKADMLDTRNLIYQELYRLYGYAIVKSQHILIENAIGKPIWEIPYPKGLVQWHPKRKRRKAIFLRTS